MSTWVEQENIALSCLCRSSQYGMVAGASRENGMETPMHENPEWEKARQALASISKAGAASSSKASSSGPVASAQVRRACRLWGLRCWGGAGAERRMGEGCCLPEGWHALADCKCAFSITESDEGKRSAASSQPGSEGSRGGRPAPSSRNLLLLWRHRLHSSSAVTAAEACPLGTVVPLGSCSWY